MVNIGIVGAGIIGLSTGVCLQNKLPSANITILASKFSPETTGDGAAGIWTPIYLMDTPHHKIMKWSKITWEYLKRILESQYSADAGVFLQSGYILFPSKLPEKPSWHKIPFGFREMTSNELSVFKSASVNSGYTYTTIMSEGRPFIKHMSEQFLSKGGKFVTKTVNDFDDLEDLNFDVLVNCAGLGARHLCNDHDVVPIRGQIHRVVAPQIKHFIIYNEDKYIVPGIKYVVCGGTHQNGNFSTDVSKKDKKDIFEGVAKLMPCLKDAKSEVDFVGLRPGRRSVRIETEQRKCAKTGKDYWIVHNYGHGGSGLTIFQGCAEEAGDLVASVLRNTGNKARL